MKWVKIIGWNDRLNHCIQMLEKHTVYRFGMPRVKKQVEIYFKQWKKQKKTLNKHQDYEKKKRGAVKEKNV